MVDDYETYFKINNCSCRVCEHDVHDDLNDEGWWCGGCDAFNFWDETKYKDYRFTIVLEDKTEKEPIVESTEKFKKQLSPLRYPRREK